MCCFVDGEWISLGEVILEIMEMLGYMLELVSILVYEYMVDVVVYGVLIGDVLFIGDVGCLDLFFFFGMEVGEFGRMFYDSV